MKKILLIAGLIVIVGVIGGFYIHHRIKISNFNEKLQIAIGKDQGITETILKAENESSSMSFNEMFEMCDKSVKERTDMIIELRGLYPEMQSQLKDSLIEFLNEENELIRNKSQSYRKYIDLKVGYDSYRETIKDWKNASYYMDDYYHRSIAEKFYEVIKDADNMKDYLQTFYFKYQALMQKEKYLTTLMDEEGLRFNTIFSKYQKSNISYYSSSQDYVKYILERISDDKPTIEKWGYFE